MSFEDFAKHFTQLDIVHVSPDDWMTEPALHSKQPWRAVLARRRWRTGYNAGGGPSYTGELKMRFFIAQKHRNAQHSTFGNTYKKANKKEYHFSLS